jgi:hypothetical protein
MLLGAIVSGPIVGILAFWAGVKAVREEAVKNSAAYWECNWRNGIARFVWGDSSGRTAMGG